MKKVCVFGDSIGRGVVLPDEGRYKILKPEELGVKKEECEIKNYSIFGCTVQRALPVVEKHVEELSDYQNVFLELGGNDCDFDWQGISENPEGEFGPKTPLNIFERTYKKVIETILKAGGDLIVLTFPPIVAERYFKWIAKGKNGANILKWLGGPNTMYRWQEMYNLKVLELAIRLGVKVIDIRSVFLEDRHYERLISRDGIHPSKKGYELIYKTIAEQWNGGAALAGANA